MQLYAVHVYDPETGDIVVFNDAVTAIGESAARDKAVRKLSQDVDLDKVKVVVVPLG